MKEEQKSALGCSRDTTEEKEVSCRNTLSLDGELVKHLRLLSFQILGLDAWRGLTYGLAP